MKRAIASAALLGAAVLVQTTIVDRLPLPWGVAPDVVVLVVVALALRGTAVTGALAGFFGGIAVDVLPPADHEIGRYAMVLCLTGYIVGALRETGAPSRWWPFRVAAGAVLMVSLAFAFIGLVLGDPRISMGTVVVAVPLTLVLTMAVSPLVLLPVLKVMDRLTVDDFAAIGDAPWLDRGLAR